MVDSKSTAVEKIYPTVEELSTITTLIRCTEPNCDVTFKTEPNLNLHLAKKHKKFSSLQQKNDMIKQFFCPNTTCDYHGKKSFSKKKYVKQHYMKVHLLKSHECSKCNLKFGLESQRSSHEEYCGVKFNCLDCTVAYTSYETLLSHAKRKNHKISTKQKYKITSDKPSAPIVRIVRRYPLILPKEELKDELIDIKLQLHSKRKINKRALSNKSRETQTQNLNVIKSSSGTQTELVSVHSVSTIDSLTTESSCRKSIKTQTTNATVLERACNTTFDINATDSSIAKVTKASFGTQTLGTAQYSNLSPNIVENGNDMFEYINDASFCNTNMETQTDILSDLELLDTDIYSNTYTQTCDEILPPALQFNNTHTQTAFNDILRSVGSQTNMVLNGNCVFMSHNETQTDQIFRDMLLDINS